MLNMLSTFPPYDPFDWINVMMYEPAFKAYMFIGGVIFWLVGHIFLSIAIYHMTKKQGYKKLWLSFIPLVNFIPLGKLVGKTTVWGMKIKNVGLWASITGIIYAVFTFILKFGDYVEIFEFLFNVTVIFENQFLVSWVELTTTSPVEIEVTRVVANVYMILSALYDVASIANLFFYVSLVFLVFRLYCPQRSFLFSILSVFIDPLFGIFLFVCRKNPKHVIIRQAPPQGGYYGGGYYGAPRNYNENAKNTNQKPENPFPEFDGESSDSNKNSNTDDDFFN